MKRLLLITIILLMLGTLMAKAVDGLTVGAGLIIFDINAEDLPEEMMAGFYTAYEATFINEALELDVEVGLSMFDLNDPTNIVDIEIEAAYRLTSGLSFILNSYTLLPFHEDLDVTSYLTPGIKLRQTLSFGNIYFQADVPFNLVNHYYEDSYDAFDLVGLDFTLSILNERKKYYRGNVSEFPNGFGAELQMCNFLKHADKDDFLENLNITPFYSTNSIYAEIEVNIPLYEYGMDFEGLTVSPRIEMDMSVDGLSLWLDFPISQIGADKDLVGKPFFGTFLGVSFSF